MLSGRAAYTNIKLTVLLSAAFGIGDIQAQSWPASPGSFLEPNRFAVVGEIDDAHLWLEAGFGRDIFAVQGTAFGLEALIWSRLRSLSGFRFPVETADYFFGAYSTFDLLGGKHRLRTSHISAHWVDGADTVIGGSSSRFSKEFISLERAFAFTVLDRPLFGALGVRYLFHQVTKRESAFQVPASLNFGLFKLTSSAQTVDRSAFRGFLFVTASADAGPSWFSASYGTTLRLVFSSSTALDLFARYYAGRSRAGVETQRDDRQLEIGMQVLPFQWVQWPEIFGRP